MKHGPIALVEPDMFTVAVAVEGEVLEKMIGNIMEIKARSGPVVAVATDGDTQIVSTGVDADAEALQTRAVAHLQVFQIGVPSEYSLARGASMYGGGPWRGAVGIYDGTAPADDVSLEDTHVCYPQPLTDAELHVRGRAPETGGARVVVVNLQGEVVRDSGTLAVDGGAVFEFVIDMRDVASGVYLCKLTAGGQTSVRTIAVAR